MWLLSSRARRISLSLSRRQAAHENKPLIMAMDGALGTVPCWEYRICALYNITLHFSEIEIAARVELRSEKMALSLEYILLIIIFTIIFCAPFFKICKLPFHFLAALCCSEDEKSESKLEELAELEQQQANQAIKDKEIRRMKKKMKHITASKEGKNVKNNKNGDEKTKPQYDKDDIVPVRKKQTKVKPDESYTTGIQKLSNKVSDKARFNDNILNGRKNNAVQASTKIQQDIETRMATQREKKNKTAAPVMSSGIRLGKK